VPRRPWLFSSLPAVALVVLAVTVAGCNVLFVPRKPAVTPSPTPNTAVHQFPALEARFPGSISGQPVQTFSLTSDPTLETPKTLEVLRRLNKTVDDLQLAKGFVSGVDVTLSALRIVGVDATRAAATFQTIDEGDPNTTTTYVPAIVVGKHVLVRTTGATVEYMYPLDDVIFVVGGSRPNIEEALTGIH
jgi:hypothetical protein